jgi:DNA (cytosine-5)-methyltransferase 1
MKSLTFIDLFCGCGGFTLGMLRAGFDCLAAVDSNPQAISTLRDNLATHHRTDITRVRHALHADLTKLTPLELSDLIGTKHLDVVVGGPPCQGFSTARQSHGGNHGSTLVHDPRRLLFENYLDHVKFFQPKIFVFENVLGLRSTAGGAFFTEIQHRARTLGLAEGLPGYRVHAQIEKGEDLGVPQKRRRQLIIGVRQDIPGFIPSTLPPARRAVLGAMMGDAILDLPVRSAGAGDAIDHYDLKRRETNFLGGTRDQFRAPYLRKVAEVENLSILYNHDARPHSARDLRDFLKLAEGESSAVALKRGEVFEFPYGRHCFKDRYTRQHRNQPCSTIVAHLAKDGLMFIHPVQNRTLTPREAARIQTFPDWFRFPKARTHAFRLIGNAVPPLIAEAIGNAITQFLLHDRQNPTPASNPPEPAAYIPKSHREAFGLLSALITTDRRKLKQISSETLIRSWHSLFWLFVGLHPDNALDHGTETYTDHASVAELATRFRRSGWPVALKDFGREAWRRFQAGEFSEAQFHCSAVQIAALSKTDHHN